MHWSLLSVLKQWLDKQTLHWNSRIFSKVEDSHEGDIMGSSYSLQYLGTPLAHRDEEFHVCL